MTFSTKKILSHNKTLYECPDKNRVIDFVLVHNTDVLSDCFVYDITVYWQKQNTKRCFRQARHKENLLDNPTKLAELFNENKKCFPLNAELGWKDSELDTKDIKILGE